MLANLKIRFQVPEDLMKINSNYHVLIVFMIMLTFRFPFVSFAEKEPWKSEAKVAAERDAKTNADQLLWGGATFVLSIVGGYLLGSPKLPVVSFSSGPESKFIGSCLLGSVGVIGAIAYDPLVPSEHLLGKSPEYVMLYTETYKKKVQSLRVRSAFLGCLGGSLIAGLLLGSFTSQ